MSIPSILEKIIAAKKLRLASISGEYKKDIYNSIEVNNYNKTKISFFDQMSNIGLSIIGEVKKGSPSCGVIKEDFKPIDIAKEYENVVDAISVLTEEDFFYGSKEYLKKISENVKVPLLRKDFIIDEFQIYESKVIGASCILLIASILSQQQLKDYIHLCKSLDMDALVEVHTEEQLHKAITCNAKIIGINNRNLHTFETDIKTTLKLSEKIPKDCLIISESGFHKKEDVMKLKGIPVNGILVGESFMRARNIMEHAEELRYAL